MRKVHASSTTTSERKKPQAASTITASSSHFTNTIRLRLSNLSASWPLVAENSRKGRMNSAPIASPAIAGGSHATCSW